MTDSKFTWKDTLEALGFEESVFSDMVNQEEYFNKKLPNILNKFFENKEHIAPQSLDKNNLTLWTYLTNFMYNTDNCVDLYSHCQKYKYYIERDEMFGVINMLAESGSTENIIKLFEANWPYYWDWFVLAIQPDNLERRSRFNDFLDLIEEILKYEKSFASKYPKLDNEDLFKVINEAINENDKRINEYNKIIDEDKLSSHDLEAYLENPPMNCMREYKKLIKLFQKNLV